MKALCEILLIAFYFVLVKSELLPCYGIQHLTQASNVHERRNFRRFSCSMKSKQSPNFVIVGGGWSGLGAAYHLAGQGFNVTVLDAAPNTGGLAAGLRPENGTAIELGMKGFWFQVRC